MSAQATREVRGWTPGPWSVRLHRDEPIGIVQGADRIAVATTGLRVKVGSEEDEANARLIAAAPEMYEALRALIGGTWIEDKADESEPVRRLLAQARAALAKASGTVTP